MPVSRLKEYLDANGIRYVTISHSPAYTAQGIAASAHISGREVAKTVVVKIQEKMIMVVLPAPDKIDFDLLQQATQAERVELATETAFEGIFPGCEVGAMPPFGNLYGLDVLVEVSLAGDEEIVFNAGTHTELIRMSYSDFSALVRPTVVRFSAHND